LFQIELFLSSKRNWYGEFYRLEYNEVLLIAQNTEFFITIAERTSNPTEIGRRTTINFAALYFILCCREHKNCIKKPSCCTVAAGVTQRTLKTNLYYIVRKDKRGESKFILPQKLRQQ
jgi:hypothetical protein